jgi:hypothetical protein
VMLEIPSNNSNFFLTFIRFSTRLIGTIERKSFMKLGLYFMSISIGYFFLNWLYKNCLELKWCDIAIKESIRTSNWMKEKLSDKNLNY